MALAGYGSREGGGFKHTSFESNQLEPARLGREGGTRAVKLQGTGEYERGVNEDGEGEKLLTRHLRSPRASPGPTRTTETRPEGERGGGGSAAGEVGVADRIKMRDGVAVMRERGTGHGKHTRRRRRHAGAASNVSRVQSDSGSALLSATISFRGKTFFPTLSCGLAYVSSCRNSYDLPIFNSAVEGTELWRRRRRRNRQPEERA